MRKDKKTRILPIENKDFTGANYLDMRESPFRYLLCFQQTLVSDSLVNS